MLARILALVAVAVPAGAAGEAVAQPKPQPLPAFVDMTSDADVGRREAPAVSPATVYRAAAAGRVTLSCLVDVHGLAEKCQVTAETPRSQGLAEAALELRPTLKLAPAKGPDGAPANAIMVVNLRFQGP